MPATARPIIKATLLGAVAQTKELSTRQRICEPSLPDYGRLTQSRRPRSLQEKCI